jgi:hypothetical protein
MITRGVYWILLVFVQALTIQQCPICFVIGLLMYESVHFADLFLAYGALLNSYSAWVIALIQHNAG